ncbi:unnamed protein product [Merluccius merluccius]
MQIRMIHRVWRPTVHKAGGSVESRESRGGGGVGMCHATDRTCNTSVDTVRVTSALGGGVLLIRAKPGHPGRTQLGARQMFQRKKLLKDEPTAASWTDG